MKTCQIIGRKYSTEKRFKEWDKEKQFPSYEQIDEHKFPPKQFESIRHAEIWLLENFPEYYFGANIKCLDNTDFSCIAIPSYYEGYYKTDNRQKIINTMLEELKNIID